LPVAWISKKTAILFALVVSKRQVTQNTGEPFMKDGNRRLMFFLFVVVVSSLFACATLKDECPMDPGTAAKSVSAESGGLPIFELPMPGSEGDKGYLGLTGNENFKVGQIKAQVVIIEVFSFYCPHCQRTAAQINDLYQMIEKRTDLKGKIKMIGIGAKNSAYEVDAYKERYQVPFPLFPDEDMAITEKLSVKGTPTFIGVKVNGKGNQKQFYFGEGGFQDNQKFLTEIIRSSGL
jgi:thiol-disulfide isomerase/thioredoxin